MSNNTNSSLNTHMNSQQLSRSRPRSGFTGRSNKPDPTSTAYAVQQQIRRETRFTLNPRHPKVLFWDSMTLAAMAYTCIVTPVEVAMFETAFDAMWAVNRTVDFIFVVDMWIQFHLQYIDPATSKWVTSRKEIRHRYLHGWFGIDLLSVFPFDSILLVAQTGSRFASQAKVFRVMRIVRLIKLVRVLRAARVVERLEQSWAISYSTMDFVWLLLQLFIFGHWMACCWCLLGFIMRDYDTPTWLDVGLGYGATSITDAHWSEILLVAEYWAWTTMTSVGYGDVTPVNLLECGMTIVMLAFAGCMWAYAIGAFCSFCQSSNPERMHFRHVMDDVNSIINMKRLDSNLATEIRAFMHNSYRKNELIAKERTLLNHMSPGLSSKVASQTLGSVFAKIHWIDNKSDTSYQELLGLICMRVRSHMYAPKEAISGAELHVIHSGVVKYCNTLLFAGSYWGDDMLLNENSIFKKQADAESLSFCCLYRLPIHEMRKIVAEMGEGLRRSIVAKSRLKGLASLFLDVRSESTKAILMERLDAEPWQIEALARPVDLANLLSTAGMKPASEIKKAKFSSMFQSSRIEHPFNHHYPLTTRGSMFNSTTRREKSSMGGGNKTQEDTARAAFPTDTATGKPLDTHELLASVLAQQTAITKKIEAQDLVLNLIQATITDIKQDQEHLMLQASS